MYRKILLTTLTISVIGLVMIYSSSNIWAYYRFNDSLYYLKRQIIFFVIGIILMFVLSKVDYHIYQKHYQGIFLVSLIMMILVLIPGLGVVRGGSRSWFNLGIIALQPSEIFKLAIIIYASNYISEHYHRLYKLKRCFKLFFMLILGFGLIMLQPDFGSGLVLVCSIVVMLITTPFLFRYFVMLGCTGILGIVGMILAAPYRMERITSYLDPFSDPLGSGFQSIQALFSVAPGGILGVGFNNSIQKHFYLPEPQTDFIFAIFLEEFGLIGCIVVVGLYCTLFISGYTLASKVNDLFGSYLCIGIISLIAIQSVINLGVVVGLLPVTGVTLPLMSYGGTSLVTTLAMIGILLNISKKV